MSKICSVSNCNSIPRSGFLCEKHVYRMKKFGSYDKPSKKIYGDICRVKGCGKPRDGRHSVCGMHRSRLSRHKSTEIPAFSYPEGIVHECEFHGFLPKEQAYSNPKTKHYSCAQCRRESDKRHKNNNPTQNLNSYKRYIYVGVGKKIKISKEDYEKMLVSQNGVCAICKKEETSIHPFKKHGSIIKRLAVDHCHKTGKIRGLLCERHNKGLGFFQDSIEILEAAILYLKKD